jgi:hypothetical protein
LLEGHELLAIGANCRMRVPLRLDNVTFLGENYEAASSRQPFPASGAFLLANRDAPLVDLAKSVNF